jgi:tRNA threonylcarbamoyladenosine biosynthesis protein TsaE
VKLSSKNEEETREIGFRLGKRLKRGDVVCLYGELGTGKTTMVKGIASALGISGRDITSASFSIVVEYETDPPFYHIDLYRLGQTEVSSLGLYEYMGREGIAVIEWAERAEGEIPDERISVSIRYSGTDSRDIEIKGVSLDRDD